MLRLFKKKRPATLHPMAERAFSKLSRWLLRLQTGFARKMSGYDRRLSVRQRKITWLVICAVMCSFSGFLLYRGTHLGRHINTNYFQPNNLVAPENITLPDSLDIRKLEAWKEQQRHTVSPDSLNH